jgi:hypothetical protein
MLTRRQYLLYTSSYIAVFGAGGCSSSEDCGLALDDSQRIICKNRKAKTNVFRDISLGMFIGAIVGGGLSVSLGFDPLLGALAGAVVVGGGVAAVKYAEYLLEKENQIDALIVMNNNMSLDAERIRQDRRNLQLERNNVEILLSQTRALVESLGASISPDLPIQLRQLGQLGVDGVEFW